MTSTFPTGATLPQNTLDLTTTGGSFDNYEITSQASRGAEVVEEWQKLSFLVSKVGLDSDKPSKKETLIQLHAGSVLTSRKLMQYDVDVALGHWPHLLDVTPGCFDATGKMLDYMVTGLDFDWTSPIPGGSTFYGHVDGYCQVTTTQPGFRRALAVAGENTYLEAAPGVYCGGHHTTGLGYVGRLRYQGHLLFSEIVSKVVEECRLGVMLPRLGVRSVYKAENVKRDWLPY